MHDSSRENTAFIRLVKTSFAVFYKKKTESRETFEREAAEFGFFFLLFSVLLTTLRPRRLIFQHLEGRLNTQTLYFLEFMCTDAVRFASSQCHGEKKHRAT